MEVCDCTDRLKRSYGLCLGEIYRYFRMDYSFEGCTSEPYSFYGVGPYPGKKDSFKRICEERRAEFNFLGTPITRSKAAAVNYCLSFLFKMPADFFLSMFFFRSTRSSNAFSLDSSA